MNKQIKFDGVKGYASYSNAQKRGQEVEEMLNSALSHERQGKYYFTWLVIALESGRFVPVFAVNNLPGGPGMLIGMTNVCTIN